LAENSERLESLSAGDDDLSAWRHSGAEEVYRDDDLWVLEKPAGVLSHPNPPIRKAPNAVLSGVYNLKHESYQMGRREVFLVHRLDQETSGLIVCTFSAEPAARLKESLRVGGVEKEYRALLLGVPRPSEGEWADHLRKKAGNRSATVTKGHGPTNACTLYRVLQSCRSDLALLALRPQTGRTHQLRVQSALRRCPILGDERYGDFTRNHALRKLCPRRMYLHALRLSFDHPVTGAPVNLESRLPKEFKKAWDALADE
jgi:RluA family pseudouridine synthase